MHPSTRRPSVPSEISTPPSERKRKRPARHSITSNESVAELQAGKATPTNTASRKLHSPVDKRPKQSSKALSAAAALARAEMYSFPTRTPVANGNGIVDLTKDSPTTSPRAMRGNGNSKSRIGLNPHVGAKKLVVKNLKTHTSWDSKAYLEKIWDQVDEALAVIFNDRQHTFSKEELYRGVENVSRQGGASTLHSRLDIRCKSHIEQNALGSLLEKSNEDSCDNVALLRAFLDGWTRWKAQMLTIRAIFFFLDRSYLLPSSKPTLSERTPQLYRDIVFSHAALKSRIIDGSCELVAMDRDNQGLDRGLFRQAVEAFHELSVYTAAFEPRFLGTTQRFVAKWSEQAIQEKTVSEYVRLADALIAQEVSRCEDFALDTSTRRDVLSLLEEYLVTNKEADLTDHEALATLLDNNAAQDIAALYALLKRRRLGKQLQPAFEKWVDATGTSIVFSKDEDNMVVRLLSLKRRLDELWRTSFQRDENLGHGLRESFETFMNKTQKGNATWGTDNTKVGEMIAKYVNQLLRGGAKAIPELLTARRSSSISMQPGQQPPMAANADEDNKDSDVDEDAEIATQLDQVLDLFRFLHGKAVFEAFYKKDLARRLLMARSASADAERSMLARLKTECGSGFTQNLEQMFKDMELAREEMQSYKQRLEDRIGYEKGKAVDLNVNILSAAAWPTYPEIPVVIPENVKRAIDDFELHYKSKHSGRKLEWKHALAHCQLKAKFGKGSKELVVSGFQAVVLLLFNGVADEVHLSYNHILTETGLSEPEVKRTLQSLACANLRPLTKHPKGKEINTTDTFTINQDFSHPKYRVKINQVQLKETKEENKETHIRVAEDRNFECQAAIVRILKSRKTISHQELVSETIKATMSRGVLAVSDIKKNIDRLIEKDYMEREDGNMYSYIA